MSVPRRGCIPKPRVARLGERTLGKRRGACLNREAVTPYSRGRSLDDPFRVLGMRFVSRTQGALAASDPGLGSVTASRYGPKQPC